MNKMPKVASIVGLGLIGGSMALALKKIGIFDKIIGVDNNDTHQSKALQLGIVDEVNSLENAINESDLIVIAIPVDGVTAILPSILDKITSNQVVIDASSTKKTILDCIKNHAMRKRFVASHPMAGTEFSGPEAALHNLFEQKTCVLCNIEENDSDAIDWVKAIFTQMKMNLIYMDAEAHDIHTAYVSHISHISSFALALTVLEKEKDENQIFSLAAGGFSSTVRLAKSNPDTWIPIFKHNQENVIDVLDEYITTLLRFKGLMLSNGYETMKVDLAKANEIKRILNKNID